MCSDNYAGAVTYDRLRSSARAKEFKAMNTIWDLQVAIQDGATCYGSDPGAPYATQGQNYWELWKNTQRETNRQSHATNHCHAMARRAAAHQERALALDWGIAAIALSITDPTLSNALDLLLEVVKSANGSEFDSWADALTSQTSIERRLLGVSVIRALLAAPVALPRSCYGAFISYIIRVLPDICKIISLSNGQNVHEQMSCIKGIASRLDDKLRPLRDAIAAHDLTIFCKHNNSVPRCLNDGTVVAILTPFLPRGFVASQIPLVFSLLEELRTAPTSELLGVMASCRAVLDKAAAELDLFGTFAARCLLLPLICSARRVATDHVNNSDAAKPASLRVAAYQKKYPFSQRNANCSLRFLLRNDGPGPAMDITAGFLFGDGLAPTEMSYQLHVLEKGSAVVDLPVTIGNVRGDIEYHVSLEWRDYDGAHKTSEEWGSLVAQPVGINWEALSQAPLYSLEAVSGSGERQFIGRKADLNKLLRDVVSRDMGSAFIYGQKRVGKTSLAHELARLAHLKGGESLTHIYLDNYVRPTAPATIQALGTIICKHLQRLGRGVEQVSVPNFSDSLAPLGEMFDELFTRVPDHRVLVVLDEFDEMPLDLYKRSSVGDAFFLTLRSLSSHKGLGFVLVGGEKMSPILDAQGDNLNKWAPLKLDYFDRSHQWLDFQELVRRPADGYIEFSDDGIEAIYEWSEGNPYFCTLICQGIVTLCLERKDAFVTRIEVEEAARAVVRTVRQNSFQHFWEDGVLAPGNQVEEVSIRRRRILLALANILQSGRPPSRPNLADERILAPLSPATLDAEVREFVARGILTEHHGLLRCRVRLFQEWLHDKGPQQISIQYTDPAQRAAERLDEETAHVTSSELLDLSRNWGTYRGREIGPDILRGWLDQFGTKRDQRLMYQLLRGVRFYSQHRTREKLREAMGIIKRRTVERRERGQYRRDLLVTTVGGPGKSGTKYARMFAQENRLLADCVVNIDALKSKCDALGALVQAVVVIDDFIGTGETAAKHLEKLFTEVGLRLRDRDIRVFYITVCGCEAGRQHVARKLVGEAIQTEVYVCDALEESDKAFAANNPIFNDAQRSRAREIAFAKGAELEPSWPLGFGNCEALVVFDDSCPNNTLPILWKKGKAWQPLFPRQ